MNLKETLLKKSNLWHIAAIALFVVISCVYFSPALKGYTLKQGDITNFVGMSREIQDYRSNDGNQIFWTNAMFSGMPSTQISMKYEGTWLTNALNKLSKLGLPAPIFFLFVSFICFYILAMVMKIKPLIGMIGSLAFGLTSYSIIILEAGHNSKAMAIAIAPLMIAGFIKAYRSKNWILGVALSSVFFAFEVSANHVQITYYMAMILVFMGIVELIKHIKNKELPRFFKITFGLIVGYALAVMINYGNIFGTLDYAKHTIRGGTELTISSNGQTNDNNKTSGLDRAYITNWSYGLSETFTLIVPNFKGGASKPIGQNKNNRDILKSSDRRFRSNISQSYQYWGDQPFTSGPVYIGIITIFLAFLALFYVKDKYKWALLSVTLLTICLSWGKNFVSIMVILPILLYLVNIFLEGKKRQLFTFANTFLLLVLIFAGDVMHSISLTDFFINTIPGYNKFRAVTILLVVAGLCFPLLGILFLQLLYKEQDEIKNNIKGFYYISASFILLLLVFYIAPNLFNSFLSQREIGLLDTINDPNQLKGYQDFYAALENTRIEIFRKDIFRSISFLVLSAGLIFAYLKTSIPRTVSFIGLGFLILLDLIMVDMRFINTEGKGKNYDHWTEVYKTRFPFNAGEGEKQILALETQNRPEIKAKIDSAIQVLRADFKGEKISRRERQVKEDYLTYRMLNRLTNFRVFEDGNPFNSSYTSYFNKSVGGYHGAKLGRYQELIEFHLSNKNPAVIDMLNVKYHLYPQRGASSSNSQLTKINPNALGNAWFAKSLKYVENADEEIMAMSSEKRFGLQNKGNVGILVNGLLQTTPLTDISSQDKVTIQVPGQQAPIPVDIPFQSIQNKDLALIADTSGLNWILDSAPDSLFNKILSIKPGNITGWNPRATTIIDKRYKQNISKEKFSGVGTIDMTSYHPDNMLYKSKTTESQFVVFSEIYYKDGWKAYIDNKETSISRVNYVLRAIEIPAGEHEIKFVFIPESYQISSTIANIGNIGILIILIIGFYFEFKKKEEKSIN